MKNMIVAYGKEFAIGQDGDLPWGRGMRADREHFRELTVGHTVIMGSTTFDSLPERLRPLPNRQNIILSLSKTAEKGFQVARNLEDAYSLADDDEVFVIGGAKVYTEALPTVDRLHVTRIPIHFPQADTFFPDFNQNGDWQKEDTEVGFPADAQNIYPYFFVTYSRTNPIP